MFCIYKCCRVQILEVQYESASKCWCEEVPETTVEMGQHQWWSGWCIAHRKFCVFLQERTLLSLQLHHSPGERDDCGRRVCWFLSTTIPYRSKCLTRHCISLHPAAVQWIPINVTKKGSVSDPSLSVTLVVTEFPSVWRLTGLNCFYFAMNTAFCFYTFMQHVWPIKVLQIVLTL